VNQDQIARCLNCRSEVSVPDSYADDAQIACGHCAVQLRIMRRDGLRLVIADLIALRETLRASKSFISETKRDLQAARASWGIGVNGFGIGVLYIVARLALEGRELNRGLVLEAMTLAIVVGVLLELANYLFLAKRRTISSLTEQLKRAVADQREIERKVRESSRR
jgi:DNA-directed RNA polymerase subunit RPC12/RpoP